MDRYWHGAGDNRRLTFNKPDDRQNSSVMFGWAHREMDRAWKLRRRGQFLVCRDGFAPATAVTGGSPASAGLPPPVTFLSLPPGPRDTYAIDHEGSPTGARRPSGSYRTDLRRRHRHLRG